MGYWFLHTLSFFFSILPFWVLYILSDLIQFVVFRVFRYRKEVILRNIRNSFPKKGEEEVALIAKKFRRFFVDVFIETFKLLTISRKNLKRRFEYSNVEVVQSFLKQNKSIIIALGHCGNWEWAGSAFRIASGFPVNGIYKTISSKAFDRLMLKLRSSFGMHLIPRNKAFREILSKKKETCVHAFIADQTPAIESAVWVNFLNQETPFFQGPEKIAKKLDIPVFYASIQQKKRGFYVAKFELISETPNLSERLEITKAYAQKLERDIMQTPHMWLWSHNKWKHKR